MQKILDNKFFYVVLALLIIVLILLLIIYKKNPKENTYNIELIGDEIFYINIGDVYTEQGFIAVDSSGNDCSDMVIIKGNVDTTKVGSYEIKYILKGIEKIRTVVVQESYTIDNLYFELVGDNEITIDLGSDYVDLGFIATYNDEDISSNVEVLKDIDINTAGTYIIEYKLLFNDLEKTLQRTVIVIDKKIEIELRYNDLKIIKDKLYVVSIIKGDSFDYLVLPNGSITYENIYSYEISENGTYEFVAYNKNKDRFEKSITINNIDKEIDKASCNLKVYRNKSVIEIDAEDLQSGIKNYLYEEKEYTDNKIELPKRLTEAKLVVYDNLGNSKRIDCKYQEIEKEVYGFILVGDSRFADSVGLIKHLGSSLRSNDKIIAKGAMGYNWLETTAVGLVNKVLKANPNRVYYIMINLGYNDKNDEKKIDKYIKLLNKLAEGDWKGHVLGYISVNPYMSNNLNDSTNKYIIKFNSRIKNELKGYYYCDTYNGIGYSNFKSSDKVHYDKNTDIAIYNYIINNCAF